MSRRRKRNISSKQTVTRPVPRRTCLACHQAKSKRELLRIVRTPEGEIELDVTGKKPGRGAYICPDRVCWEKAKKDKHLEHALKCDIKPDNYKKVFENGINLIKELNSG